MRVYITKYSLTEGILEKEVFETEISKRMVVDAENRYITYHKPHWHTDREKAVKQAEKMRLDKIQYHERNLVKMKELKFE